MAANTGFDARQYISVRPPLEEMREMNRTVIDNARVLGPEGFIEGGRVVLDGDTIAAVGNVPRR